MSRGFVQWADIEPTVDGECRVRLPWPGFGVKVTNAATGKPVDWKLVEQDIVFPSKRGERYRLAPHVGSEDKAP
jgi:hypothetical protein